MHRMLSNLYFFSGHGCVKIDVLAQYFFFFFNQGKDWGPKNLDLFKASERVSTDSGLNESKSENCFTEK